MSRYGGSWTAGGGYYGPGPNSPYEKLELELRAYPDGAWKGDAALASAILYALELRTSPNADVAAAVRTRLRQANADFKTGRRQSKWYVDEGSRNSLRMCEAALACLDRPGSCPAGLLPAGDSRQRLEYKTGEDDRGFPRGRIARDPEILPRFFLRRGYEVLDRRHERHGTLCVLGNDSKLAGLIKELHYSTDAEFWFSPGDRWETGYRPAWCLKRKCF
jgi:hypothetical protein